MAKIDIPSPADYGEYWLTAKHVFMDGKQVIIHAVTQQDNITRVELTNGTIIQIIVP